MEEKNPRLFNIFFILLVLLVIAAGIWVIVEKGKGTLLESKLSCKQKDYKEAIRLQEDEKTSQVVRNYLKTFSEKETSRFQGMSPKNFVTLAIENKFGLKISSTHPKEGGTRGGYIEKIITFNLEAGSLKNIIRLLYFCMTERRDIINKAITLDKKSQKIEWGSTLVFSTFEKK